MKIIESLQSLKHYMQTRGFQGNLVYRGETSHMVRAANNSISLNTTEHGSKFFITVQNGKRLANGSISAAPDDEEKIRAAIDTIAMAAAVMPEIPFLTPLKPIARHAPMESDYDAAWENIDSAVMKDFFRAAQKRFTQRNTTVSGQFSCGMFAYGVANTLTQDPLYYQGSDFNIEVMLQLHEGRREIRADLAGKAFHEYQADKLLGRLDTLLALKEQTGHIELPPKPYDIVFGSNVLAVLVQFLMWLGLSGEAYEYEMGMLQKAKHKIGDRLFSPLLTMRDDPAGSLAVFHRPFGTNGVLRPAFPLVSQGVLANLYYSSKVDCDRFAKTVNNDAAAADIFMETGDGPADFAAMVQSCANPTLYIGYLHYPNSPNRANGEITGTSRFGTFLIEKGAVQAHVTNLRLNDTLFNLFNHIEWVSAAHEPVNIADTYGLRLGSILSLPACMKINQVNVTGS